MPEGPSPVTTHPSTRKVTLERVARDASVSISTVSKVLNSRPGVSSETRDRVEYLLEKHGYQPRGRLNEPSVIEVVYTVLDNEWVLEVLQGVQEVAQQTGHSMVLTPAKDVTDTTSDWIELVIRRRATGVVLLFSDLSADQKRRLRNRAIPFVVIDPAGESKPDVPYVGSQNWHGGVLAAQHLIALGHRKIATITGPDTRLFSRARMSGFTSVLDVEGIALPADYVRAGSFHVDAGLTEGRALLSLPDPPTAIFAGSDLQAMGVYDAAHERGLRIPEDLSVIGYDDLPLASWAGPPLTTVHQPVREMAVIAARMVTGLAESQSRLDLAVNLVVRSSTAAPHR